MQVGSPVCIGGARWPASLPHLNRFLLPCPLRDLHRNNLITAPSYIVLNHDTQQLCVAGNMNILQMSKLRFRGKV